MTTKAAKKRPAGKRTAIHPSPSARDLAIGSVSDDLNTQAAFAFGLSDAVRGHGDLAGSNVSGLLALVDVHIDCMDALAERLHETLNASEA